MDQIFHIHIIIRELKQKTSDENSGKTGHEKCINGRYLRNTEVNYSGKHLKKVRKKAEQHVLILLKRGQGLSYELLNADLFYEKKTEVRKLCAEFSSDFRRCGLI